MNKRYTFFTLLVCFLLIPFTVYGQRVYYVRTDGNDANTGFFNTAADAKLTVQNAVSSASNGDVILVQPGTYNLTSVILVDKSLYIRGDNATLRRSDAGFNIVRITSPNVTFENFTLEQSNTASTVNEINIGPLTTHTHMDISPTASGPIVVSDIRVDYGGTPPLRSKGSAIYLSPSTHSGPWVIKNCILRDTEQWGIYVNRGNTGSYATGTFVLNNIVENHRADGIGIDGARFVTVAGNRLEGNHRFPSTPGANISVFKGGSDTPSDIIIRGNYALRPADLRDYNIGVLNLTGVASNFLIEENYAELLSSNISNANFAIAGSVDSNTVIFRRNVAVGTGTPNQLGFANGLMPATGAQGRLTDEFCYAFEHIAESNENPAVNIPADRRPVVDPFARPSSLFPGWITLNPWTTPHTTVFVSPSGNESNEGITAGTPKQLLNSGIRDCSPLGQVQALAGVYNERVSVNKSLTLTLSGTTTVRTLVVNAGTLVVTGANLVISDSLILEGGNLNGNNIVMGNNSVLVRRLGSVTVEELQAENRYDVVYSNVRDVFAENELYGGSGDEFVRNLSSSITNLVLGKFFETRDGNISLGSGTLYLNDNGFLLRNGILLGSGQIYSTPQSTLDFQGALTGNRGTLTFSPNGNRIDDLRFDLGNGFMTLSGNVSVEQNLSMLSGRVDLQNATITVGSSTSVPTITGGGFFHNGILRVWVTDAPGTYTIPLGTPTATNGGFWNRTLTLAVDPSVAGFMEFEHVLGAPSGFTPHFDYGGQELTNVGLQFWTVNFGAATATNYTVSLRCDALEPVFAVSNLATLRVSTFDGSVWSSTGTSNANSGSNFSPVVVQTGITATTPQIFTIAGNVADNPLPVELSSFTGKVSTKGAELQWRTASEFNNAGFIVLRDDVEIAGFGNTSSLRGRGTTSQATTYTFVDGAIEAGRTYTYRLKTVDFSGAVHLRPETVTLTARPASVPLEFALKQNFPNPFNPSTSITYSIREAGLVTLKVYDLLGREVTTLVNEQKEPGLYDVKLTLANNASGMYFYKLQSNGQVRTMKMVLSK